MNHHRIDLSSRFPYPAKRHRTYVNIVKCSLERRRRLLPLDLPPTSSRPLNVHDLDRPVEREREISIDRMSTRPSNPWTVDETSIVQHRTNTHRRHTHTQHVPFHATSFSISDPFRSLTIASYISPTRAIADVQDPQRIDHRPFVTTTRMIMNGSPPSCLPTHSFVLNAHATIPPRSGFS